MVYADRSHFVFLAVLLIVIPSFTLSAESDYQQSDDHVENDSHSARFRDKRTLDIILQGLAQMLGYRLQRNNAPAATNHPTPPPSPPTDPPKLVTEPPSAPPTQIVFVPVSDSMDLKHKETDASQGHTPDSDKNSDYPYSRNRDGHNKDDNGDGYFGSDYSRDGHGKDDHGTEKSDKYYRSRYRSDKIDDYVQKIGHHVKGQFRGRKKYKDDDDDEDKMGRSSEKNNNFKNNDAGSDQKWDKEHVKNEYDKLKGFDHDGDNDKVSGRQHSRDDDANTAQEQREVTSKSDDDDDDDESSNKADSRSPENIKEKLEQNHNDEEEDQKSTQENSEHEHSSRQDSSEKNTTDQNQGEQSKEEEHQDSDHHNQIPAPALRTWDDDFWKSHYSFEDNNSPYSFGLLDAQRSDTDEQKDKPSQPDYHYTRPQYFDGPGFEPVHEWHVSSRRRSKKPSFESSESQSELKEEEEETEKEGEETSRVSSDSPEESTDPSVTENFDPTEPPTHGQYVTDKPPIPIHSTSRPKLAQLIHEIEGTKQNPLWPPPFEHGFEGTDSSVDTQRPEQTNVTSSKKAPDYVSPLLMNLYNYTSVSDYLLDLNKKDLLQKQPSQSSQQHEKFEDASQNDKSPVSYVAVVIPHASRRKHAEKSDHLMPLKPSIVGVAYPQELLSKYEEHVPGTTSTKSDSVKDNETPTFKLLTKSHISNLSHDDYVETQDLPLETHYNPLLLSSALSLESNNSSGDHVQTFPDSYLNTFFHNPETLSNTNIQPQGVRNSDNSSHHDNGELQYGGPYYRHLFQDPEANSKPNDRGEGSSSSLYLKSPSDSPDAYSQYQNDNIQQYFDSRYDNLFIQNPGTFPNTNPQIEVSSSVLNSKSPSNFQKEDTNHYPDTHYNSFLQTTGPNTKTNDSSERSPSVLNFRHPANPSEETYSHIQNGNVNHYPEFDYSAFQNVETQLLDSTFPHSSYNNDQGYQGDKAYNPSEVSSDEKQVPTTPKPLRLVIPESQPHTLPSPQTSQLRVVIPDAPQSASFFDFSSGNEQNEPKSDEAFDKLFGFMTIPSPTPYSDHLASLKNPEKWVLGDDAPSDKNVKTKERTIHVSKTRNILSLLEKLIQEIQPSVSRAFNEETMQEKHHYKETGTKAGEMLDTEKQTAEEIQSGCRCSKGQAIQEMQVLNRRLVQLGEMLAAYHNNVVHLHKSRALLSAQIRATKRSLREERVSRDSLSHQTARLNQKNSHLKARLSYSHAQYRSQLADARCMLGTRNAKVNRLRSALIKVRDLCHSIDSSYRMMLWEIGKQVQLIAEMVARNCHLEWSQGLTVAIPTAADLKEWYQQIWYTTRWIQLHIPSHQFCVQQPCQAEGNKPNRASGAHPNLTPTSLYDVKTDASSPLVAGNSSDFSFDVELSLDMSNTVQPTATLMADLDSTTCSSLSQDFIWQHEASQDRHQMQYRFLTILDNLKVKLLQLRPGSIQ